jgi:hypothetical protein
VGRAGKRQLSQRTNGQHRHTYAGLHVEDARTVQPAALLAKWHALELAEGPDRIEVTEEEHAPSRAGEVSADVISAGAAVDTGHLAADRFEARPQFSAAPVNGGLVGAGRLETNEDLDGLAQPGASRFAPGDEI